MEVAWYYRLMDLHYSFESIWLYFAFFCNLFKLKAEMKMEETEYNKAVEV